MPDYDEKEDLMDRLLALGKRKKFLSLDQLHREIPENMMSADDIEDVLERLEGANISVAETDAQLLERAQTLALDDEELHASETESVIVRGDVGLEIHFLERDPGSWLEMNFSLGEGDGSHARRQRCR